MGRRDRTEGVAVKRKATPRTTTRKAAKARRVPSTPAELAKLAAGLSRSELAQLGAAMLLADRIERLEMSLMLLLQAVLKPQGIEDEQIARLETAIGMMRDLYHLNRGTAATQRIIKREDSDA